ncbi:Serine/threonine-protein kinase PknH [Mycobacterium basiliense]|uniref:Serine/threonine-protein kinase PknH n=1 Tax=Mycobacterium basiliense TaxID=2094119 RepID=A0A3S4FT78_9MYCO|nr:sensor domain-containing protein [Mycobacterium basiliense]VDM90215.1 Serine/threonine-protein kinase PknH [Mycobacterium basiliense]
MRQLAAAVAVAALGVLVTSCGGGDESTPASSTSTSSSRAPIEEAALDGLLLTPAEVDSAMGVTGMTTKEKIDKLPDDSTKEGPQGWKWPAECLFADAPAEAVAYAGSGYTAVRGHDDVAPGSAPSGDMDPELTQALVLFPSAAQANDFFTKSSQAWPACANRQFITPGDADNPEIQWQVGPVSTANGMLSTPVTVTMTKGPNTFKGACQRVLTVRNNVAIDLSACGKDPGDLGITIANQIAGKVDKQ